MLHQIGVGALGPVYRTYEPIKDRLVAVKVFRLDITPEQARDLADALRHATESELFHPSIVEPLAAGVEGTVAYRAEEYVAGESLDVAMRHYAPAPLEKALPCLTQLAGAIDFARAAGVGHGALHLRDIFVTPDEARASGFGVVEALERVGLRAPVRRPYSAPERIAGSPWGTPADVFSLAAIAFELLIGRRPSGTGDQIGTLPEDAFGAGAAAVRAVLARAMHEDPARRYATALGFVAALEEAGRSATVAAVPAAPPAPSVPPPFGEPVPVRIPEPVTAAVEPAAYEDPVFPDEPVSPPADEVTAERDEDEDEDYEALLRVQEEVTPLTFGDERDEALLLNAADAAASAREENARLEEESPADEEAPVYAGERRTSGLSGAAMLVLGLVLGAVAGYVVWGRSAAVPPPPTGNPAVAAPAPVGTAVAPSQPAGQPGEPGKPWSDQTVAQPPAVAPRTPAETAPGPGGRAGPRSPARTTGRIVVQSVPSGAGVVVNGQWKGRTPLTLPSQEFGNYVVRVAQPGFTAAEEVFSLSENDPDRTLSVRLQRPAAPAAARPRPMPPSDAARGAGGVGSLYVDSRPTGATVYVDDEPRGTTPARLPAISLGSHVVRLELAGYRAWIASTHVTGGQETRVTGSLERIR